MKILHTSDWHIGQRLYNRDREEEHQLFFDWLIQQIDQHKIDILLVSGDIFDVGYPSNAALKLYYQTLTRLQNTHCKHVVIIGGNHDSVSTLHAPREILKYLNVHIVGGITGQIKDEIIEIRDENNTLRALVAAVPFLRDRDIRQSVAGETYLERSEAIRQGIIKHYSELAEILQAYKNQKIPIIAMGHLFAVGAIRSESERDIHIGTLGNIEVNDLPSGFDYVALGHIHKPQIIGKNQRIRYSGSPIPLSFSERSDNKSLVMIDFSIQDKPEIALLPVPNFRKLVSFSGSFSKISSLLTNYQSDSELSDWAEIKIEEEKHDPALISRFEQLMESLDKVEILKYFFNFKDKISGADQLYDENTSLDQMDVKEVFDKLLEKEGTPNYKELKLSFNELIDYMSND